MAHQGSPRFPGAFTLIELLVVIAIIGELLLILRWDGTPRSTGDHSKELSVGYLLAATCGFVAGSNNSRFTLVGLLPVVLIALLLILVLSLRQGKSFADWSVQTIKYILYKFRVRDRDVATHSTDCDFCDDIRKWIKSERVNAATEEEKEWFDAIEETLDEYAEADACDDTAKTAELRDYIFCAITEIYYIRFEEGRL